MSSVILAVIITALIGGVMSYGWAKASAREARRSAFAEFEKKAKAEKVFGFAKATEAFRSVQDRASAKAVLAVVCGVLGYKNEVAEEAALRCYNLMAQVDSKKASIRNIEEEIGRLRNQISENKKSVEEMLSEQERSLALAALFEEEKKP